MAPVYRFVNETPQRVPLTDWYETADAKMVGFQARPVIGGVFIKMLYDQDTWKKWASRDITKANGPWAPLPELPVVSTVVEADTIEWRYMTEQPGDGWFAPEFDDAAWKHGKGAFGTKGTPGITIRRKWDTPDIWLRGKITIPDGAYTQLMPNLFHDEDAELYVNGVPAAEVKGYTTDYTPTPLNENAQLGPGTFVFAVHCHQSSGGQGVDLGIVDVSKR